MSSNVLCPKIPNFENVNQPIQVVPKSIKKTHEGESFRKSPRVRRKVNFTGEEHTISNLRVLLVKMLKTSLFRIVR